MDISIYLRSLVLKEHRQSDANNLHQVGLEFRQLFDILVHPIEDSGREIFF